MATIKTIAVIPAYNEEKTIYDVVNKTKEYVDAVVVVDDGSLDKTRENALKAGAIVVSHPINMGLGFSLGTGCALALSYGADVIVTLDGDGQHNPSEIPKLINTLERDNLDVVFGSRAFNWNMPLIKRAGNTLIHFSSKILFDVSVCDTQTGFRAFKASCLDKLRWSSHRYPVASEIIANVGKNKLRYREIPVETIYDNRYRGTTVVDGIRILANMVWWRIRE